MPKRALNFILSICIILMSIIPQIQPVIPAKYTAILTAILGACTAIVSNLKLSDREIKTEVKYYSKDSSPDKVRAVIDSAMSSSPYAMLVDSDVSNRVSDKIKTDVHREAVEVVSQMGSKDMSDFDKHEFIKKYSGGHLNA